MWCRFRVARWSRLSALAHVSPSPRKEPLVSAHRAGRRGKEAGWLCSRLQCYGDALSGVVGMRGNTALRTMISAYDRRNLSLLCQTAHRLDVVPPYDHLEVVVDEDPDVSNQQHEGREHLEHKYYVEQGRAGRSQQREE